MRLTPLLLSTALAAPSLGLSAAAGAQTLLRTVDTAPFVPLVGGQPLGFLATNDAQATVDLGFDFPFQGQTHRFASVSTNGGVVLSSACGSTAACPHGGTPRCQAGVCVYGLPATNPIGPGFPDAMDPQAVIAPLWDDLDIVTGTVTFARRGVAPAREWVVQWREVRHASGGTGRATAQLVLSEDGTIRMHYGPMPIPVSESANWSATAGFEDHAGTSGDVALPCAALGTCTGSDLALLPDTRVTWSVPVIPELVGAPVAVPTGGGAGALFTVELRIDNLGTATTATTVQVDLRLSADTLVDDADPLLARREIGVLPAQDGRTLTVTATIPAGLAPRLYTLGAILDPQDRIPEADETNNVVVLQRNFLVGRDLSARIDTPAPAGPGDTVDVTVQLVNLGAATASVTYDILYSQDTLRDGADVVVFSGQVSLPAGDDVPVSVPVVLPAIPAGLYYALVDIDPGAQIVEFEESNNLGFSPERTQVRGPDLVAASISTPDAFATPGAPLRIEARIDNDGDGAALGFAYTLRLSQDALCTVNDLELLRIDNVDLGPGASLPILASPVVPLSATPGPGRFLCLLVNGARMPVEDRYGNNIAPSQTGFDVSPPRADVRVFGVRTPDTIAAGEAAPVERVVQNQGLQAAAVTYQIWLSEDEAFDATQDVLLDTPAQLTLGPDEADVGVDSVVVLAPQPPGRYHLLYVVDPAEAVPESDETNNLTASAPFDLVSGGVRFVTTALPAGARDAAYAATLIAVGGTGPITFDVFEGALPAGLTLAPDGALSGTPTEEGRFDLVFRARAGGVAAFATLPILIVGPTTTLTVATRALPVGTTGLPYGHALVAVGGAPPYTWRLRGGGLPQGLTLAPDGVLSGTPALAASAALDLQVEDALGATAQATLALNVRAADAALRWAASPLPDGELGASYAATLSRATGSGGTAPFTVRLVDGALPPGLTRDGFEITGTPTDVGVFTFDLQLEDADGDWDRLRFVLEIVSGREVAFFDNAVPDGVVGQPYTEVTGETVQLRATPVSETRFSIHSGALPPGLALAPDGTLAGTPTDVGVYSFVVEAATPTESALAAFGIEVRTADGPAPLPTPEPGGCRGGAPGSAAGLLLLGLLCLGRRRRATLALGIVAAPALAHAQVDLGYGVETRTAPYQRQSGTPYAFVGGPDNSDVEVGLPFSFAYFDQTYDRVQVGSNGLLVFGGGRAVEFVETRVPNSAAPNALIAPWWDDLTTGRLEVAVVGPPGQREVVFDFSQVQLTSSPAAGTLGFQVRLHEGRQGRFDVCYGANTGSTNGALYSASTGFEDPTGSRGRPLLTCGESCEGADFTRASNTCVTARRDLGPDLSAIAVDGPARAVAGLDLTAQVRIDSLSSAPIGPFVYELFVVGPSPATTRRLVARSAPTSLDQFAQADLPISGPLPAGLATGLYRFGVAVDVDGDVAEPDETDNEVLALDQTVVLEPRADLVASSVTRDRAAAAPGEALRVTAVVQNVGARAADAAWRVVVSSNPVASPLDRELARGSTRLAAGSNLALDEVVTLPADLAPGQRWIGVVVDPEDAVVELDELDNGAVSPVLEIIGAPVTVVTTALADARLDLPYRQALAAAGGDGAYTWRLAEGALPDGLSLDPGGEIRGTPRAVQTARFTVEVASAGGTDTAALELGVTDAAGGLAIVTRNLVPGTVGRAYPPQPDAPGLAVVGAVGAPRFSLDEAAPPGLTLAEDGRLSGIPEAAGDYTLQVRVTDDVAEATRAVGLTVAAPGRLTLVPDRLPAARLGQMYQQPLRTLGPTGGATVAFSALDGAPPGLQVTRAGLLVGTPSRLGRFTFGVEVEAGAQRDEALFTLVVEGGGQPVLRTDGVPRGLVGAPYRAVIAVEGLSDAQWSWAPTRLPDGVQATPETVDGVSRLVLAGTPTRDGKFTFLLVASDDAGRAVSGGYTIVVDPEPVEAPDDADEAGCRAADAPRGAALAALALLFARRRRRFARAR